MSINFCPFVIVLFQMHFANLIIRPIMASCSTYLETAVKYWSGMHVFHAHKVVIDIIQTYSTIPGRHKQKL